MNSRRILGPLSVLAIGMLLAAFAGATFAFGGPDDPSVPTTLRDFYEPGTQPGPLHVPLMDAMDCSLCHGGYDESMEPYTRWTASMMGQGSRDPIFWAALAVAEQAAPNVGDLCTRCHAPLGWLDHTRPHTSKTSTAPARADDGISCSMCHRLVDPIYTPGVSPAEDEQILAALPNRPVAPHSAQFVLDPEDRRRGPFSLPPTFEYHQWLRSPFHNESRMCATCHDVSNPLFVMQPDGSYRLDTLNQPHPSQQPYDQFPLERTYSEWNNSAFAQGPIEMNGRFGGNITAVSSCQDCHMPKTTGTACHPLLGGTLRSNLPQHDFRGATNWMLRSVRNLYSDGETGLTEQSVNDAIARNTDMLARASDTHLAVSNGRLIVRIINESGHKLPTGHLEGRRMWVNARFFDAAGALIAEHGAYDTDTATLTRDTKIYEAIVGLDETLAAQLGQPAGPSHLFPLNNKFYQDNRIPPRGFTNAAFAAVQCAPVGATYRDGQFWDDTQFTIPPAAARIRVSLYYQTITREAVEGLYHANTTNNAGKILHDQWLATGKGAPIKMSDVELSLAGYCRADFNHDGALTPSDFAAYMNTFNAGDPRADLNDDGALSSPDFMAFMSAYALGCH